MRIIHLLKHCEPGNGHVHVAVDLACEQSRRGHDVIFGSRGGPYTGLLASRGVRHVTVEQSPFGVAAGMIRLTDLVRRTRPDAVHAHMMAAAMMGYVATRLFGGALITTVHNSFDSHSVLMRLGDRVVAVSEAERRLLIERGYPPEKLVMVHNGPLGSVREALRPEDGTAPVSQPYAMTLSGLHRRKRVGDVITAFAGVAADFPDWRLAVVGGGPDEGDLVARVSELGMTGRVIFTGYRMNPRPLLRGASIFITLSEAEPFGLVVAEARAEGCAIVASEAGGMPEVVDSGRAGQLVPVGDVEKAGAALRGLMSSPAELARWRAAAELSQRQFTVGAMADDYEHVYAAAAAMRARRRPERRP